MPSDTIIIVSAYNEADRLSDTLAALARAFGEAEVVVADDGSVDGTADVARDAGATVVRSERTIGKGGATTLAARTRPEPRARARSAGLRPLRRRPRRERGAAARPRAGGARRPLRPRRRRLRAKVGGGFGFAVGYAHKAIRRLTGSTSGPDLGPARDERRGVRTVVPFAPRFGMEIGMTVDAARGGFVIEEVQLDLAHRATGKTWRGSCTAAASSWTSSRSTSAGAEMETPDTIASLYRESTAGDKPDPAFVEQLLGTLHAGEEVLFTCGWPDNGEKWGPIRQLTVTSRRILDQRTLGAGVCAPVRAIALADVLDATERGRAAVPMFTTHALVVDLADGSSIVWEHLTNHQIGPAAEAIAALGGCLTAGVAAVAQNRGIQLNKVTAVVEGKHNILGILGGDPEVRNGFNEIDVKFDIDADATPEEIASLLAQSQKRSAVFDALTNPTTVNVSVA